MTSRNIAHKMMRAKISPKRRDDVGWEVGSEVGAGVDAGRAEVGSLSEEADLFFDIEKSFTILLGI